MRIDSLGMVGISNTNPLFELCIGAQDAPNRNGIEFAISNNDTGTNIVQNYNRATAAYTPMSIAASVFSISTGASATERMRIASDGDVFIADDQNSAAKLYVKDLKNGSESSPHFQIKGNGYDAYHFLNTTAYYIVQNSAGRSIRIVSSSNGVKLDPGATAWTSNSDIALKENIKPLENVLDKIKDYRCVEYNLKTDDDKKIGFIAQDWENDFAPIVNKDENEMLGMKYTETIPVLLKAIQELKAEVDKLKQECKCKN
jgi:hypothetical protein